MYNRLIMKVERPPCMNLIKLGSLDAENDESADAKHYKETHKNQPIPPCVVCTGSYVGECLFAVSDRCNVRTTTAKLFHKSKTNRVRQRTKVLRPTKPHWDKIRRDKNPAKSICGTKRRGSISCPSLGSSTAHPSKTARAVLVMARA